ncbi:MULTISPECIES: hypothetical protein [unclassified Campylobacter]|nr:MULTISPECIES: hypothetical protein [unclassified Campylobacter]
MNKIFLSYENLSNDINLDFLLNNLELFLDKICRKLISLKM